MSGELILPYGNRHDALAFLETCKSIACDTRFDGGRFCLGDARVSLLEEFIEILGRDNALSGSERYDLFCVLATQDSVRSDVNVYRIIERLSEGISELDDVERLEVVYNILSQIEPEWQQTDGSYSWMDDVAGTLCSTINWQTDLHVIATCIWDMVREPDFSALYALVQLQKRLQIDKEGEKVMCRKRALHLVELAYYFCIGLANLFIGLVIVINSVKNDVPVWEDSFGMFGVFLTFFGAILLKGLWRQIRS